MINVPIAKQVEKHTTMNRLTMCGAYICYLVFGFSALWQEKISTVNIIFSTVNIKLKIYNQKRPTSTPTLIFFLTLPSSHLVLWVSMDKSHSMASHSCRSHPHSLPLHILGGYAAHSSHCVCCRHLCSFSFFNGKWSLDSKEWRSPRRWLLKEFWKKN